MDSRRRRRSGASDDMSETYDELNTTKETQSSEPTENQHDSEYDTAGSESDSNSQDKNPRESGDGQEEEKPQKKLDDDEDRRNPQYIPKRGTFYEHDDRTADEVNEETPEEKPEKDQQKEKKIWKDKEDRWGHDRYNDAEQAPKSHAELIAVYGYDIRNEEGPPRARRRRRYGRGPNKYTRNWEDEDAYGKVPGNVPPHKPNFKKGNRTDEEFPSLTNDDETDKKSDQPVITSAWYSNKNKTPPSKAQNFPALQQTESQRTRSKQVTSSQVNDNKSPNDRNTSAWKQKDVKNSPIIQTVNQTSSQSVNDGEKIVLVRNASRDNKKPPHIQESVGMVPSKGRGRGFRANANNNSVGNRVIEPKPKMQQRPGLTNMEGRRSNVEPEQTDDDMKHANVSSDGSSYHQASRQNKHFYPQSSSQQHSSIVPPRMQPSHSQSQQHAPPAQAHSPPQPSQPPQQDISTNRPKRYSSLRQRPPITEGPPTPAQLIDPSYQPAPQHAYYPPPQAGSSRAVLESPGYPPGPYEPQAPPVPAPGQPVMPLPPPPGAPQPASYAPPPYMVPPPQFIPPQQPPPNIINYVPGPNGPIFSPNYQSYSPAPVPPGPPPQEVGLYQPQGCTYYSPVQQQVQQQQQQVPLRRPKAAIPILPPPDGHLTPNTRLRSRQSHPLSQSQELQQQHEQILQQQQQQEQLVQQQLQQHQQQLIQEQQQELMMQQERERQQREQTLKQLQALEQQQQQLQIAEHQQQQQQIDEVHQQREETQESSVADDPERHQQIKEPQEPLVDEVSERQQQIEKLPQSQAVDNLARDKHIEQEQKQQVTEISQQNPTLEEQQQERQSEGQQVEAEPSVLIEQQNKEPDQVQEPQHLREESAEARVISQNQEANSDQQSESDKSDVPTAHVPIEETPDSKEDEKEEFHDAIEDKLESKLEEKAYDAVLVKNDTETKEVSHVVEDPVSIETSETIQEKVAVDVKHDEKDSETAEKAEISSVVLSDSSKDANSSDVATEMISADLSVKVSEMMIDVLAKTEQESVSVRDCKIEESAAVNEAAI